MGKVRRLAEDVEALRAEEAEEKKVLTTMLKRVMLMLKRVTTMLGHSCNIGNAPNFVEKKLKTVICVFWMNI